MDRRALLTSLSTGAALLAAGPRVALAQPQPVTGGGPGALNLITDVPGLQVGQAEDPKARTGVTVILPDGRATCSVDVRGGGPGTAASDAGPTDMFKAQRLHAEMLQAEPDHVLGSLMELADLR